MLRFRPAASGAFAKTARLTASERSAEAIFVRVQTAVRRSSRSRRVVRTFSLTRAVALR